ncbi:RNA-directed DNA polymerase from mobile element jockey, partial [Araneus ventricosus]
KHFPLTDDHYELTEEELPDIEKYKFTKKEIENSIKGMKRRGAPGYDGWTVELVEECYFTDSEWFTQMLNTCFINGVFPENWKRAEVILIPKEGKDLKDYKSYRPICLLPVWGKILDKLIANRLTYFLEENQILNNNQYGFRNYNSTINALQGVTEFIGESKALNRVTCMVSLDIENAFNSMRWSNIKQLLEKYKVPRYLGRLLNDFLKDRSVLLTDGTRRIYNQGVPQGSCLEPIMWLLVANKLLNDFEFDENHRIQAFADDIIILMRATASYHFVNNSQDIMKKLENWAAKFRLKFSKRKTKYT